MTGPARTPTTPRLFGPAVLAIMVTFVGLRAYAIAGSWFRLDDIALLSSAAHGPLTWTHLESSYAGHLSPGGRLLTWLWFDWFGMNWTPWAIALIILNALVALGILHLLVNLFGRRLLVIALLAVALASAVSLPTAIWWAGATTSLPMQLCLTVALSAWLSHLRNGRRRHLLAAVLGTALGLSFSETALIIPVLCLILAVCWFVTGSLRTRSTTLGHEHRLGTLAMLALPLAYVALVALGPGIHLHWAAITDLGPVAGTLLFRGLANGLLGGPFAWSVLTNGAVADVSTIGALISVALLGALVVYSWRRRTHALLGWWPLLAGGLGSILGVWLTGPLLLGSATGLDVRHYPELPILFAISVGLVFVPVKGAPVVQQVREATTSAFEQPAYVGWASALLVGASILSSFAYLNAWTDHGQTHRWFTNLKATTQAAHPRPVPLIDAAMPARFGASPGSADDNLTRLTTMVGAPVSFPDVAIDRLFVLDDSGHLQPAVVTKDRSAFPPANGGLCHAVSAVTTSLTLDGPVVGFGWWVSVDYQAAAGTSMMIAAGETKHRIRLLPGRHTLFFDAAGNFSSVQFNLADDHTPVCLGGLSLGLPVAGAL